MLTHLKFATDGLAALSFILLVLVAILAFLLLKTRKERTPESREEVEEEEDDPLSTLAGPRSSDNDIRVPEVKQTADSTAMPLAGGHKSSYMPLNTDDTPNAGTCITFEAFSF